MRKCVPGHVLHIPAEELRLTGEWVLDEFQAWWKNRLLWVHRKDLAETLGPSWPFGGDDDPSTPVA